MPTVSIIMPVYNTGRYLDAAIGSVLAQTYPDFELLLIDDGSTDNSFEISRSWAQKDSRIRLMQQENKGHGAARNAGMETAKGSWIQFVDSDDIILPNMVETLLSKTKDSGYDFARCRFARFYHDDPDEIKISVEPILDMATKEQVQQEFMLPLLGSLNKEPPICGTVCTTLYRREIIEKYRLSFLHAHQLQSEDLLFNLAFLCHASGGALLSEPLYLYRTRSDSFTNQYSPQVFSRLVSLDQVLREFVAASLKDSTAPIRVGARLLDGVSVCAKDLALQKNGEDYLSEIRLMTETPCVREALAGKPGRTRSFPLNLFCFLLRHQFFRIFRLLVHLYPFYQFFSIRVGKKM